MLGLRHVRKRKRGEELASSKRRYQILDKMVYAAAVVGPVMTLPQIYTIWIDKQAAGVSTISWTTYALLSTIWIAYGAVHKDRVIFFANIVWLAINSTIAMGTMIY